jgi:hypothetical protein
MKGDESAFPVLSVTTGEDLRYENQVPVSVEIGHVQICAFDGRGKEGRSHVLLEGKMVDAKCQVHLEDGGVEMGKELDMQVVFCVGRVHDEQINRRRKTNR